MPITITCPSCAARINAPDAAAGKKVKCPKCQHALVVPVPNAPPDFEVVEDEPVPAKKPPAPAAKPKPKAAVARDEDEDEAPDERPRTKRAKAAVEDNEDEETRAEDEEEKPKTKRKGDDPDEDEEGTKRRPKKKTKTKKPAGAPWLLIGGGAVLLVAAVVGVLAATGAFSNKPPATVNNTEPKPNPTPKNEPSPPQPVTKEEAEPVIQRFIADQLNGGPGTKIEWLSAPMEVDKNHVSEHAKENVFYVTYSVHSETLNRQIPFEKVIFVMRGQDGKAGIGGYHDLDTFVSKADKDWLAKYPPPKPKGEKESKPDFTMTAVEFTQEYEKNAAAADAKFKGKVIRLTGKGITVWESLDGKPYVSVQGGTNDIRVVYAYLRKGIKPPAADTVRDKPITVEGVCNGIDQLEKWVVGLNESVIVSDK